MKQIVIMAGKAPNYKNYGTFPIKEVPELGDALAHPVLGLGAFLVERIDHRQPGVNWDAKVYCSHP